MTKRARARLVVVGAINQDQIVSVPHIPLPGETVLGRSFRSRPGGKGANQAAAAARAGAEVTLVSAVGQDDAGRSLLRHLASAGVDIAHVVTDSSAPSGVALIAVSPSGENSIVVALGAAAGLDPVATAGTVATLISAGDVLLTQLELPQAVVTASCSAAGAAGARVVLNYSPVREVPADVLVAADPLIVNAGEAAALAGFPVQSRDDAERAARSLAARARSVVITLGPVGAVAYGDNQLTFCAGLPVTAVDTTGAGDSFAGALAAALGTGATLHEATLLGIAAGAATVQHEGAQPPASAD
ncbi:PfkB family carbohydrate kinase [Demequina aurantiaca]|uniref:PfkB family carbohydrate kinase n=1 Tax=Demequina aurantiaca TaxID=676200 RepID=UPI003D33200D